MSIPPVPARAVSARAPGRVNLIGEHTDYNGGACLPIAIDLGTTVRATRRDDDVVTVRSGLTGAWEGTLADVRPARAREQGWAAYVAGVLWALQDDGWPAVGVDLEVESDLPAGGGLSSSAALECAVAVAMCGLLAEHAPSGDAAVPARLAQLCRRAETEYVGAPTGGLDQLASMLGRVDHGVLVDFAEPSHPTARPVPIPLGEADLVLVVTDSGVRHQLADGDGGYALRRRECEEAADLLGVGLLARAGVDDLAVLPPLLQARARHVVTEHARVHEAVAAVAAGEWAHLGRLMDASHESLRVDFEVTVPATDLAASAARDAGALGARMTGGGFGGCTVALTQRGRVDAVQDGVDAAYASQGLPRPAHHVVMPAAGARLT